MDADNELAASLKDEAKLRPVNMNLAARKLVRLPPEIGLLVDTERLGLNNNMLSSLPDEFSRLVSLRYLNLRSNALREFPVPLRDLPRLEVLDLSKNKIERFPTVPASLINLRDIGSTSLPLEAIAAIGETLIVHFGDYRRLYRNCQTFAEILVEIVCDVDRQAFPSTSIQNVIATSLLAFPLTTIGGSMMHINKRNFAKNIIKKSKNAISWEEVVDAEINDEINKIGLDVVGSKPRCLLILEPQQSLDINFANKSALSFKIYCTIASSSAIAIQVENTQAVRFLDILCNK
eukprot:jgi/Hompol1/968/HPOL_000242-RA